MATKSSIGELVDRLGRISHALQFAGGLNPAQWEALRFLGRANKYSSTPGVLAEYLGATKGTISQTLIALESKGFLRRSRSRSDRRSVDLSLTEAGRNLLRDDPIGLIEEIGGELPSPVREALTDGMDRLLDSLSASQGRRVFGVCSDCSHCHRANGESRNGATCYCGLADDPLFEEETHQICINFVPAH